MKALHELLFSMLLALLVLAPPSSGGARAEIMDEPARLMDFAEGLFSRGVYDLAAREYARLIEKFPEHRDVLTARFRLGECEFLQQRYAEAIPHYEQVLKSPESSKFSDASLLRLGTSYYFLKEYAKAEAPLKKLLEQTTDAHFLHGAHYFLGKCAQAAGDRATAVQHLEKATEGGDHAHLAAYTLAAMALNEKDFARAADYYERVVKAVGLKGVGLHAALGRAECLVAAGKSADAIAQLEQLLALNAVFPAFKAAMQIAKIHSDGGRQEKAVEVLVSALERFPNAPDAAEGWLLKGRALALLKKWAESADACLRAMSGGLEGERLEDAEGAYLRALFEGGRHDDVVGYSKKMAGQPPRKFAAWLTVAESLCAVGDNEKAVALLATLAADGPEPWLMHARLRLGMLYQKLSRKQQVITSAFSFAEFYPNSPEASVLLCNAGDAAIELADHEKAISAFSKALLKPMDSSVGCYATYRRGVARYLSEDRGNALADLKQALQMPDSKPYRDKVLLVLGDIEQARGSYPEAIVYFRRLVDEHPESRDVVDARLRLGACYYSRQLFDKSAEEYLLVVKAGHTDKLPQEVIVWALNWFSENKRTADAIQLGEAVLKLKGLDPGLAAECMFLVGETLERAARYPEASSRYRELLKEHPTSARRFSARVGLARCLRRTGEHAGAEKLLNELIGETTGVVKSLATIELASLQLELKRLDDALRNYLFVAILEPREDLAEEALYRSAVICSQLGRADDASRYASEFVSRFPGSKHRAEVELLIKAGR